jgi:hypothetical protein
MLGAGLIEAIPDAAIIANMQNNAAQNNQAGVHGHANAIQGGNANLSMMSERALGRPHAPRDRSIDVHLSSIRQKLGTHWDGRPLIQTIHRRGYLLLKE